MQHNFIGKFFIGASVTLLLAIGVYNLPPIHERLSWRVELATTYLRGILYPADHMPAPVGQTGSTPVSTPTPEPAAPSATPGVAPATATAAPTSTPTPTPTPIPGEVELPAPAYDRQDINNCGPATLSMYLRFYGWEGDQTDVVEVVKPIPEDRNVNVEELDYFVRNHAGWLSTTYRVGGTLEQIKRLLAAGMPVMIEETFRMDEGFWPNDDLWAGHYLLVTGYDDERQIFTAQDSYYGPDQKISYPELDENWKAFNRVLIAVYPPEQEEVVKSILGADWDPDVNREHALQTAMSETEADPQDAFAWFNLGTNLVYFERYGEAAEAYDTARQIGLPQRMFRYQFGPFIADFHAGRTEDLLALTEYALQRTPNSEEALLWRGWVLYRSGETTQAVEQFQKALEANPLYGDAQYALDFVNTQQ